MKLPHAEGVKNILSENRDQLLSLLWRPYTRLFLVADADFWALGWEMKELDRICKRFGVKSTLGTFGRKVAKQSVFFSSHFELFLTQAYFERGNRLATSYFHGLPGTGVKEFDACFKSLVRNHEKIWKIQVTHQEMHDLVLSAGTSPEKVFVIPIGINIEYFPIQDNDSKRKARERLGIPQSSVVVGSFQKDGVGWGDGNEPKLIKGPDVFIETIKELKTRVSELFVLLSGPARGYIKKELNRLKIPFTHHFIDYYPDISMFYQAIDVYIVSSRQEGGPKAILESMSSGVPIISTRVGQATTIIRHGENGWLADIGDSDALAQYAFKAIDDRNLATRVRFAGRETAEKNCYAAQVPLWNQFMCGFVDF